jgi:hypothetical protein
MNTNAKHSAKAHASKVLGIPVDEILCVGDHPRDHGLVFTGAGGDRRRKVRLVVSNEAAANQASQSVKAESSGPEEYQLGRISETTFNGKKAYQVVC